MPTISTATITPTASQCRGSSASHRRKRPGGFFALPLGLPVRAAAGRGWAGRAGAARAGRVAEDGPEGGAGGRCQPSRPRKVISSRHSRLERPLPGCSTASPASRRRVTVSIWEESVAAPSR
jgi:hypothetical protein